MFVCNIDTFTFQVASNQTNEKKNKETNRKWESHAPSFRIIIIIWTMANRQISIPFDNLMIDSFDDDDDDDDPVIIRAFTFCHYLCVCL